MAQLPPRHGRCARWPEQSPESFQYGVFAVLRGDFSFVRGVDIIKLTKIPLIYSVSLFNFGGLGALFGDAKPTEPPPSLAAGLEMARNVCNGCMRLPAFLVQANTPCFAEPGGTGEPPHKFPVSFRAAFAYLKSAPDHASVCFFFLSNM